MAAPNAAKDRWCAPYLIADNRMPEVGRLSLSVPRKSLDEMHRDERPGELANRLAFSEALLSHGYRSIISKMQLRNVVLKRFMRRHIFDEIKHLRHFLHLAWHAWNADLSID